ncbi:MAG: amylo-alpha-1,6-glucosidase [Candidatus Falkowbacteria bacterium]
MINEAYKKSVEVLTACVRPVGFYASGLRGGYEALWARDSMTCSLGASLVGDTFKSTMRKSIELLSKNQTELGLIPNCVGSYNEERQSDVTFNSIDAPLWYVIGQYVYAQAYHDTSLLQRYEDNIAGALTWLRYQDPNNDGLIVQQPTGDWMDAFPHKYGRVLHTQAMHYAVLRLVGDESRAEHLKNVVNGKIEKYLALYDSTLGYYHPWAWKDHGGDKEQEDYFDAAANFLAIISGLATPEITKSILDYVDREAVNRPYPCKAIWPPIKPGDAAWKPYFSRCDAREPFHYLNGGIWPWTGGLYVAALVKAKQFSKAEAELEYLAQAIMQSMKIRDLDGAYECNEWLDGITGEAKGEPYQAWTAGMYIYAHECVKQKKVLYFA